MKIYEYKSITDISDKYIDKILIESYDYKNLEKYILNETAKELKFIKAKLKFNSKKYTKDEVKHLAVEYISEDNKKNLYNIIANNLVIRIPKIISLNLKEESIKADVFDDENEFIKNINNLLKVINICELISYIRIKHETLYHVIAPIIKEWENSSSYMNLSIDKDEYKLNYDKTFNEKYGFKLDFKDSIVKNKDGKKVKKEIDTNLDISDNDLAPNIETIMTELNKINFIFNKSIEYKAEKISLEKKLEDANNEIDIINEALKDKDAIIKNLHVTIKSKNDQENKLKIELNDMKKSSEKEKKLDSKQIKKLEKNLEEIEKKLKKYQISLHDMENKVDTEKRKNKLLNEKYANTELELGNTKKSNNILQEENKNLLSMIEELKSRTLIEETATDEDSNKGTSIDNTDLYDPFGGILDNEPIFNK